MNPNSKKLAFLWAGALVFALLLIFARTVYPEFLGLTIVAAILLLADLVGLVLANRAAFKSRAAAYGFNSLVTALLVICIIGLVNFIANRHELKVDLTKNKIHSLSDQSEKAVKAIQKPIKATLFVSLPAREKYRVLMENYHAFNPKFDVEYVNLTKEPTRARQAAIKEDGTLVLAVGERDQKITDPTEEKVTNASKLNKDKTPTLCAITGHGEKSFSSTQADGLQAAKKELESQAYQVKDLSIAESQNKIPETCDAIAVLGPNKAFFPPELQAIKDYLANGGHAVVAVDINLKGQEYSPELNSVLEQWYVKPKPGLIVDPVSRFANLDASIAILKTYAKDHAITQDFNADGVFPFARPLEVMNGAPASLNVKWIAQTLPTSWAVMDLSSLAKGEIKQQPTDLKGPLNVAIAVDGKLKDSKAPRATRLVVFATSFFPTNNFTRFGGNQDLFLNSIAWVMEDETGISIRAKEDAGGKLELSVKQLTVIFLATVLIIPVLVAAGGIAIWALRRRM